MKISRFDLCVPRWGMAMLAVFAAVASLRAALADDKTPAKPMEVNAGATGGVVAPQYWFGVAVENIPPSFAKQMKLRPDQGLMVVGVIPTTPAEKAGLKADDLLLELNGMALTSQEQLARAANAAALEKGKLPGPQACDLVYLRDGDKLTVKLVPQLRPRNMLVTGANLSNFSAVAGQNGAVNDRAAEMRNYVMPNGTGVQVGPGYRFDLQGDDASASVIREATKDGQTVVMSQETDAAGHAKNSISVNGTTYVLPEDLAKMPAGLQPLANQFQGNGFRKAANGAAAPAGGNDAMRALQVAAPFDKQLDEQRQEIRELLEQNQHLQQQIDQLTRTINDRLAPPGKP